MQRILLIEDDAAIQELLELTLDTEGYAVDVASTAAEARAALAGSDYALVISDWRLPDGDGLQIADRAADRGIKTLVITGYLLVMPGGRPERHLILTKPIRPAQLVAAVEDRIGKAQIAC